VLPLKLQSENRLIARHNYQSGIALQRDSHRISGELQIGLSRPWGKKDKTMHQMYQMLGYIADELLPLSCRTPRECFLSSNQAALFRGAIGVAAGR
jgi:hypothetical protein